MTTRWDYEDSFRLGKVRDPYTLAIVCRKLNLLHMAKVTMKSTIRIDNGRQFILGWQDADQCSLVEVAAEIYLVRQTNPSSFDEEIRTLMGERFLAQVHAVLQQYEHDKDRIEAEGKRIEKIIRSIVDEVKHA